MTKSKDTRLFQKITKVISRTGKKLIYRSLLLYYAYKRKQTPRWAKAVILGTLGYFISIIDFIPDIIPGLGYTDDFFMIAMALTTLSFYINEEVREKAQLKLREWFPEEEGKNKELSASHKISVSSHHSSKKRIDEIRKT